MARGWESKSVEDQIAAREVATARPGAELTDEARARASRRETLVLARAKTLQDLQVACDRRHRALLDQTLAHLDEEIRRLDAASPR
jgi:hypothetical protein